MRSPFLLIAVLMSVNAFAVVFGGSNLGFGGYPDHSCYKPSKPFKPYSFDSQWEVDIYNQKVDSYNSELGIYLDCINEYVDNAGNDIERIKEAVSNAISEANSPY